MQIVVTINDKDGLVRQLDQFPETKKTALSRAINRTAQWVRTRTVEILKPLLFVNRVADIRNNIKLTKSRPDYLRGVVNVSPKRIGLFQFHGKPTQAPTPSGISFQLTSDGDVERLEHNAFVATVGGVTNFFKRADTDRNWHVKVIAKSGKRAGKPIWSQNKINKLWGPIPTYLLEHSKEFEKLTKVDAGERLELQLTREVSFLLTGSSKVEGGDDA